MIHVPFITLRGGTENDAFRRPAPRLRSKVLLGPGNVRIRVHPGEDRSRVLDEFRADNLVVASGRELLAFLIADQAFAPSSIALGTDGSPTTDGMVALGTEVFRVVLSARDVTGSVVTLDAFVGTADANGYTLQEAALMGGERWRHDVVTIGGGQMFARAPHVAIPKNSGVSLTYTWELPIASG